MPINYYRLKYSIPIMVEELSTSGSIKQKIQLLLFQDLPSGGIAGLTYEV